MKNPGNFRVAIVGAGIAGLNCARNLKNAGLEVHVFDKGRAVGGRLASRAVGAEQFDHGAQFFTAQSKMFRQYLSPLVRARTVARWYGRFAEFHSGELYPEKSVKKRYVGLPYMRKLAEALGSGLRCRLRHTVSGIENSTEGWSVSGTAEVGRRTVKFQSDRYNFLVLNMPPEQAQALSGQEELAAHVLRPCIAAMYVFSDPVQVDFDAVFMKDDPVISWIAKDSSKPGRPDGERWILHATPEWSEKNIDLDSKTALAKLLAYFGKTFSVALPPIFLSRYHRWRYALPLDPLSCGFIFDDNRSLGICGDWCMGSRVEGAFVSGQALSKRILLHLNNPQKPLGLMLPLNS